MKGAPRSDQFDDIYFSAENGLEETAYVFLQGNDLPAAWDSKEHFVIGETGFGTGLNFFSVWKLFEEMAEPDQRLDFISVEKYPLTPKEIKKALEPWQDFLGKRVDFFLKQYPIRVAGFHRIQVTSQITLTLIFDDINEAFPEINAGVDCWFLDGFTPAKNPDMWSETVFQQMARLSKNGATYATFTAAGDVRRGLEAAGFSVQKQKGFGHKRDMIAGVYKEQNKPIEKPLSRDARIAIIGGGLAGASCAYVLKQYGYEPVIYEAADSLAAGASGNDLGLYNPRFTAQRDEISAFYAPAYAQLIQLAKQAGDLVDYTPCGALHLLNTNDKRQRFLSMKKKWMWHEDHMQILNAEEASSIAGIEIQEDALYLPDSGSVSPLKLCEYYAQDVEVCFNSNITDINDLKEKAIIICNAHAAQNYKELSWLSMDAVRGQVSNVQATEKTKNLKCNINYGGYLSVSKDGNQSIGSTFEKWIEHDDIMDESHQHNIETLKKFMPQFIEEKFVVENGYAGFRTATNDRFPVVGRVPETKQVYVSVAFGSHGIVGSIAAAHYIADLIRQGPLSLPLKAANALIPQRFLDRQKRKTK